MLPDLNRLKVYYHVYAWLSVARAAEELHITPSAVSQQLKKLEKELKTPLFTRLPKRLVPTPAGKRLFSLIEPLIDGLRAGIASLEKARTEPSGIIRIGAPLEFGSVYLPHVIATYRNRYKNVTFNLILGRPSELLNGVNSGELDFALVDTFPTKTQNYNDFGNFAIRPMIEEQVVLACSRKYSRLFLKDDHTYQNLLSQSFISQQQNARALNNWFRHHFGKDATRLNIVLTVANHQAVIQAVRHHLGLGIIVSHLAWQEIQSGAIVAVRSKAPQAINRISLVQLLDKVPSLTEKSFLNHFQKALENSRILKKRKLYIPR